MAFPVLSLSQIIAVILGTLLYLAPWLFASARRHPNVLAIGLLNLLSGWTVIGWAGALIWASTRPSASS